MINHVKFGEYMNDSSVMIFRIVSLNGSTSSLRSLLLSFDNLRCCDDQNKNDRDDSLAADDDDDVKPPKPFNKDDDKAVAFIFDASPDVSGVVLVAVAVGILIGSSMLLTADTCSGLQISLSLSLSLSLSW
jgi:hypothetical protein